MEKVKCDDNKKKKVIQSLKILKRVKSNVKKVRKSSSFICGTNVHLINLDVIWIPTEDMKGGIWKELRGLTAKRGIPQSRPGEICFFSHHYSQFHQIRPSQICRMSDGTSHTRTIHKVKPSHQTKMADLQLFKHQIWDLAFDMKYKAVSVVSNYRHKRHGTNLAL